MDHYETLGLPRKATKEQIDKAYRKLVIKYHPDHNDDPAAKQRFLEVQAAYEVLQDNDKKQTYDWTLGNAGNPLDSVYSSFYGFDRKRTSGGEVGKNIIVECRLSLQDILEPYVTTINFLRKTICEGCAGEGGTSSVCSQCEGIGKEYIYGNNMTVCKTCEQCKGSGKSLEAVCGQCYGHGLGPERQHSLEVTIPAGAEAGSRFKYPGMGDPSPKGSPGDLYVQVQIKDHPMYERAPYGGVKSTVPVTFSQLLLGDEIEVLTIRGKVKFKLPPKSRVGAVFKLKSMGLPSLSKWDTTYSAVGDHFIETVLDMPHEISAEYREALANLARVEKDNPTPLQKAYLKALSEEHYANRTRNED